MARELAPAGVRSAPSSVYAVSLINRAGRFHDRYAAEREQAPSPRQALSLQQAPPGLRNASFGRLSEQHYAKCGFFVSSGRGLSRPMQAKRRRWPCPGSPAKTINRAAPDPGPETTRPAAGRALSCGGALQKRNTSISVRIGVAIGIFGCFSCSAGLGAGAGAALRGTSTTTG